MADIASLFARGQQIRMEREARDMEQKIQQTKLEEIMRTRVAEDNAGTPQFAMAYDEYVNPNTKPERLAELAPTLGGKWLPEAHAARIEILMAHDRNQDAIINFPQMSEAMGVAGLDPAKAPKQPMAEPTFRAALTAGAATNRAETRETGQTERVNIRVAAQERIAARNLASKELDRNLRARLGDAHLALVKEKLDFAQARLDRGGVDHQYLVDLFAQMQSGNEAKFADANQLYAATHAADVAWEAMLAGATGPEAIAIGVEEADIRPGDASKEAVRKAGEAAAKFKGGKPSFAKASPADETLKPPVATVKSDTPKGDDEAVMKATLKQLQLEDTEENRERVRRINATRRR